MDRKMFEDASALSREIGEEIIRDLERNPKQLLCIAAGHTSLGVFWHLIDAYRAGRADFSKASFVAMDEWLGMSCHTPESCGSFLVERFLSQVNYRHQNVRLWDGMALDLEQECAQVLRFIREHGGSIDYLVLGVGMNGHLALNEPGTEWEASAHVCALDPITQKVGQKYFSKATSLKGGITLGLADFRAAGRSVLAVTGENKAEILKRILDCAAPDKQIPATALYAFENASLYWDREAGAGIHVRD